MTLSVTTDRILLSLIIAVYACSYILSAMTTDTARDLIQAYFISTGIAFPVKGPEISAIIHLGPLWFYLLAIPLFLFHSLSAAALFVGLISSSKFLLAYLCGKHLIDRRFGLLWAIALAVPGWSSFEQLVFSHTNMVAATTLAILYCCIRLMKDNDLRWLIPAGLSYGLALHAHPTTLSLGVILIGVYFRWAFYNKRLEIIYPLLAIALAALPFAPYLLVQGQSAAAELGSVSAYLHKEIGLQNLYNWPAILWGSLIVGPNVVSQYLIGNNGHIHQIWMVTFVIVASLSLLGLIVAIVKGSNRVTIIVGLLCLILTSLVIALVRTFTPFYMTYVMYPFSAALLALGLYGLTRLGYRTAVIAAMVSCLAIVAQFLIVSVSLVRLSQEMILSLPASTLMDVKNYTRGYNKDKPIPVLFASMWVNDLIGQMLCAQRDRIVVHGDLAFLLDDSFGLAESLHCDRKQLTWIIGVWEGQQSRHIIGLPGRAWNELGRSPDSWIGPLGIAMTDRIIHPALGHAIPDGKVYPPHPRLVGQAAKDYRWTFTSARNSAVVISNIIAWNDDTHINAVTANGHSLRPLYKTRVSEVYKCDACGPAGEIVWNISASTPLPDWLDIVTLQ